MARRVPMAISGKDDEMSDLQVFLILVCGLALGLVIGSRIAKADLLARIGWAAVGAVPGVSFLCDDVRLVLALVLVVPILVWRHFHAKHGQMAS